MATITIRNLSDDLVECLKEVARQHGHSMEQEVRELIEQRYVPKKDRLKQIRSRWGSHPSPSSDEVQSWIKTGRL